MIWARRTFGGNADHLPAAQRLVDGTVHALVQCARVCAVLGGPVDGHGATMLDEGAHDWDLAQHAHVYTYLHTNGWGLCA